MCGEMSKDVEKNGSWSDLADPTRVVEKKTLFSFVLEILLLPAVTLLQQPALNAQEG